MIHLSADQYWNQFLGSLPVSSDRPKRYYEAFRFGTTRQSATEIAALVLAGIKTATGSAKWVYDAEHKPLPQTGDFSIVLDGDDRPVCIIETTEVRLIPFNEVDAEFAYDGGEEDRTLTSWRKMYWAYIVSECARISREPVDTAPLVCERFRVVYGEALSENPHASAPSP